ncbi:DUF2213 domain-containing protein, partial [Staphylococcus aureus]|nr:DUF2213 domain-containing protein [Staphylococcus aureus]
NKRLCEKVGPDAVKTYEVLEDGGTVEVSTGTFVSTDRSTGTYDGKSYTGEWHNMMPDHLAILPPGHTGACSIADGCGTHRAATL